MSEQGGDARIELMFRLEAALKRIEELEKSLRKCSAGHAAVYENWYKQCDRIKVLEATLRDIASSVAVSRSGLKLLASAALDKDAAA